MEDDAGPRGPTVTRFLITHDRSSSISLSQTASPVLRGKKSIPESQIDARDFLECCRDREQSHTDGEKSGIFRIQAISSNSRAARLVRIFRSRTGATRGAGCG